MRRSLPVLAVLAFARPVAAQHDELAPSILGGVRIAPQPINKSNDSSKKKAAVPGFLSYLTQNFRFTGGLELGRALTNAASDSAGVVFDASTRPATTLTANTIVDVGRLSLAAVGGFSLSEDNRGGFGRVSGLIDLVRKEERPLWQIGADYTTVRSPRVPVLTSAGATMRVGDPRQLQAGIRVGSRMRASTLTPVTAVDIGRAMSRWAGNTMLSAYLSATGVFTRAPAARQVLTPIEATMVQVVDQAYYAASADRSYFSAVRSQVTLGDLALNLQVARGDWAIGGRAVARFGPSAAVWDDPVPNATFMRQTSDGKMAAAARVIWAPFSNWMMTAEGGRQLSDPIMGLSGVRYASVSLRMNFEAGQRRPAWSERQQIDRVADAALTLVQSDALVIKPSQDAQGRRLLILRDVTGDVIEIASEFTDWKPVTLKPCTERDMSDKRIETQSITPSADATASMNVSSAVTPAWCGYFVLPAGVYHLVYRSNNGEWRVPPGLAAVDDSFGGRVGLLIIP